MLPLLDFEILVYFLKFSVDAGHPWARESTNFFDFLGSFVDMLQFESIFISLPANVFIALDFLEADVPVMQLRVVQPCGGLVRDQDVPVHIVGLHALQQSEHSLSRVFVFGQHAGECLQFLLILLFDLDDLLLEESKQSVHALTITLLNYNIASSSLAKAQTVFFIQ